MKKYGWRDEMAWDKTFTKTTENTQNVNELTHSGKKCGTATCL